MSKSAMSNLHTAIGILIMLAGFVIPPFGPVTEIGVKCLFIFIGMVYLWSTVNPLWPSQLGLILLGLSGYGGEGANGFKAVFASAIGNDTVILLMLTIVLFGALDVMGVTKHIAKWCLTRKIIDGRPYLFLTAVFVTSYIMSAIVAPSAAVLIIWPVALHMMNVFGVTKEDRIWHHYFVGLLAIMCIGQPLLPFKGAQLLILNSLSKLAGVEVNWGTFMLYNIIIASIMTTAYLLVLKFIIKPDVSKLQHVTAQQVAEALPLPEMDRAQKLLLLSLPTFIILMLAPSFLGKYLPFLKFFNIIGSTGLAMAFLVVYMIIKVDGKPVINYGFVSSKAFNWGTIFMVAAAVYGAGTLTAESTGVKQLIIDLLNPILGGCSEMVFVSLMFACALLLTSFANNAGIGLVLLPVAAAFCEQMGIPFLPVGLGVGMMVFCAMLTPAACPHAAMAFGRKDLYDGKAMVKIGLPYSIAYLALYILVGYPLAKVFFL